MAIPSIRCRHTATSTGEQCKRYARPGTSVCAKHLANADHIANAAEQRMTLATLLAGDPRPPAVALQDAIHTLDSVAHQSKVDALRESDEQGSITPETLTAMVDSARGAAAVILAATRTAAWDKIARSYSDRFSVEVATVYHVAQQALEAVSHWLEAAGLDHKLTHEMKRYAAEAMRDALNDVRAYIDKRNRRPDTATLEQLFYDRKPPELPPEARDYAIVPRAELEALREAARRARPQISDKPADVFLPATEDTAPDPPAPPDSPEPNPTPSTNERIRSAVHSNLASQPTSLLARGR